MNKSVAISTICFLAALCNSNFALGQAPETARFVQSDFAIGFWVDPPLDARADERYGEIAQANFNLVIGGHHSGTPDAAVRQLRLCEAHGLNAIVTVRGVDDMNALPDGNSCWGYGLRDEPGAADFPHLRDQVEALRAARPGRLGFINLFPGYASPGGQLGAENYEAYVRQYVETVDPDILCMDHYPLFKPDRDGRDGYCADLAVMRRHALERGIPFWNFFNAMPYGPHTDPTEAQMRWQIFASIAHGARGVLYFCYYTPAGGEFPKGGALITRDDRRTEKWYAARRLNEQVKNLGPVLMQLISTGVYRIGPEDGPAGVLRGTPIADLRREPVDPPHDYLVGVFAHADGRRAVLLMNYHFAYTAWPTVVFDAPVEDVRFVDPWTGNETPAVDASPDMPGLQVSLLDGEGKLFLLPPSGTQPAE